jgi:hypothetical protein
MHRFFELATSIRSVVQMTNLTPLQQELGFKESRAAVGLRPLHSGAILLKKIVAV